MRWWIAPGLSLVVAGCAREPLYPRAEPPPGPPAPMSWAMPTGPQWAPAAALPQSPSPQAPWSMPTRDAPLPPPSAIPAGPACLSALRSLGVAHEPLAALKGVETPIVVTGPVGGLRLRAGVGLPARCDCRLAVALAWAAPRLAALGVQELTFSGAYVDRSQRSGRPSLHARGLAIDVHAFGTPTQRVDVSSAFAKGLGPLGCAAEAPLPNRAACALRQTGLFSELLTPDSNADHHDHLHLAVAPLPGSSVPGAVAKTDPPSTRHRDAHRRSRPGSEHELRASRRDTGGRRARQPGG